MARRLDPDGRTFQQLAAQMALSYAPAIIACADCGYTVLTGYCCTYCGSTHPRTGTPKESKKR
jgi:ribosomal protein L32